LLLCFLLSLGMLLGPAHIAQAQERTGTITGVLTDAQGGVLPGVSVSLTNRQTGRITTVNTDGSGRYVASVDPGFYTLRFELSGFARQEVPDIEVLLGRTFDVNATMRVGTVTEAVQVTAESTPLVDTRSTLVAHNVSSEEIDRLPKARSFQSIALTSPSVNEGEIEGGFQVNGASGAENAFTVDGVVTNSLINGSSRQNTVFEYIQEVQVKTTGIPAEYGGALGGVISAVTKSGGNTFTGEGHYYFEGSAISAGPVKRLVLDPFDDKTVSYVQDEKDPITRNEFGGSMGGPIVRDRLFFFGSVSPRLISRTRTYSFTDATSDVKQDTTIMQAFGKVSYGSRRFNAYGTVLYTPTTTTGTLRAYNGTAPNVLSVTQASNQPNIDRGFEQEQTSTTFNADVILAGSAFLTARGGYFRDNYQDTGVPRTTPWRYLLSSVGMAGVPANLQGPVDTQNTPRVQITDFDTTKRAFFNADYNHTFQGGGWHTLKGGVGFQRTTNDVAKDYPGGLVQVVWGRAAQLPGQAPDGGAFGYYEVNSLGTNGLASADIISLYVQDQWQIGDRLTLSLGVRTEKENVPSFRPEIKEFPLSFGFADKLAPRLGASYDLTGDGRVKVFGSWGLYYDWTKYEIVRGSFGGDNWCIKYRALDDPAAFLNATFDNAPGRDIWQGAGGCRDRRVPNLTANRIDPNIKPMSQQSTSAGVEYQLNSRSVLTVHYVHNDLIRTIEDLGALIDGNEVYFIGNPGEGSSTITPTSAAPLTPAFNTPKPKRQYDAVEVGVNRRFADNWFGSANITFSRLYGNYAGLASSDEIRTPTQGGVFGSDQQQGGTIARQGGNVNRAWDLDEQMYDSHGNLDILGRLATDRPVVAKFYGGYTTPGGTHVGAFVYAGSGTPLSTYVSTDNSTELFVEGRGDMGRTPFLSRTNLLVSHEFRMTGSQRLRLELNVLNLFNQKTARHVYNYLNRTDDSSSISLFETNVANGYDYNAMIRASARGEDAFDPRYNMPDLFQDGTQGQFLVKFLF
jgi:hypothetical protein